MRRARSDGEDQTPITNAPTTNEPRINDRIRAREVRLVDPEGRQLGIKPLPEALLIAQQQDLDLVEVAPLANPPVCRIMDYGKFKFDEAQRAKESRRRANNFGIKEMKYRPKIGSGDFDTKTRQVVKFLHDGHKVKITVMFRGREVFHPDLGKRILDKIAAQVDGTAKIESEARLDGKNMVMVLAPDRRARQASEAKAQNETEAESGPPEQAAAVETDGSGSSLNGAAEGTPAEGTPAEEAPAAEGTPAEGTPAEEAPAEEAPAEEAPATEGNAGTESSTAAEEVAVTAAETTATEE